MPDDQLRNRMNNWAKQHGIEMDCPACREQQWKTGELISAPVSPSPGEELSQSKVRMMQIFCSKCGYLLLFNAEIIGL